VEEGEPLRFTRAQPLRHRLRLRLPAVFGRPSREIPLHPSSFGELALVGDLLAEAGTLLPGNVFAVYRKE
jgi:hypothetical protein